MLSNVEKYKVDSNTDNFDLRASTALTYPEINIQIPRMPKLPISHLKRNAHLVILMKVFMEAFPRVCSKLDIMR